MTPAQTKNKRRRELATNELGGLVAEHRNARGVKVSELARAVGVSPSLISQIERGQSQPSVSTLFALAEALDVPVDAFFARDRTPGLQPDGAATATDREPGQPTNEPTDGAGHRYLVRSDGRAAIDIEGGVRWERLTPETLAEVDFMELVYAPGAESHGELYRHPGAEMVLVLTGALTIFVGFEQYKLKPGDSIHFPSTVPHRYVNDGDVEARAVTVILHDGAREVAEPGRP
jgi:transcriptional regulator with XRE-family HTH domain